jgi:RecB family exonuclease
VESRLRLSLADGRIELSGKVDLALGQAKPTTNGAEARTMIIDLKTGGPGVHHAADLRFYALLETVRVGVPPFRLASFYLDAGEWRCEDVDEDLLWATARRTTDGIERLVALQLAGEEPTETPGAQCRWCRAQAECPTGKAWLADRPPPERDFAEPSAATPARPPTPP